jgi:hypothetical protein
LDKWKRSEEKTIKIYGRRTPGSGSMDSKLDVIGEGPYEGLRGENKFTEKKSRALKLEELEKARKQASIHGNDYFMLLDFNLENRYIVLPENDFINLMEELHERRRDSLQDDTRAT